MPRFRVEWKDENGIDMHSVIIADNKDKAADAVFDGDKMDCIEAVIEEEA